MEEKLLLVKQDNENVSRQLTEHSHGILIVSFLDELHMIHDLNLSWTK